MIHIADQTTSAVNTATGSTLPLAPSKLSDILADVSAETGIAAPDITGSSKRALFVRARFLFAQRARLAGYKLIDIGEALGGRAHTSVLAYFNTEKGVRIMTKEQLRQKVQGLTKEEKKELVSTIAEGLETPEERDNLARMFSEIEVSRPASMGAAADRGAAQKRNSGGFADLFSEED